MAAPASGGASTTYDLVGSIDELLRHVSRLRPAEDALHEFLLLGDVLEIDGREDGDAGLQQLLDVFMTLVVSTAGGILVRQTVDEADLGTAGEDRRYVDDRHAGDVRVGMISSARTTSADVGIGVRLHGRDDDVLAAFATATALVEQPERFSDSRGVAEKDLQADLGVRPVPPPPPAEAMRPGRGQNGRFRQRPASRDDSTLTRIDRGLLALEPESSAGIAAGRGSFVRRDLVQCEIELQDVHVRLAEKTKVASLRMLRDELCTCSIGMARALATRAACSSALRGLMCGSSPDAEAVTASAGIGVFGVNTNGAFSSLNALISFTSSRLPWASLNVLERHRRFVARCSLSTQ